MSYVQVQNKIVTWQLLKHFAHFDETKRRATIPKRMNFRKSSKKFILHILDLIQGFEEGFSGKIELWFSEMRGGEVEGRLEFFWKFIHFDTVIRP